MNAITCEKSKLGFVGIGYMGRPIAKSCNAMQSEQGTEQDFSAVILQMEKQAS